jgi:hypothetical protein
LIAPGVAFAEQLPPPPPPPPNTPTNTPIPAEPTDTPVPTDAPIPTDTPIPTATPVPTDTPIPADTPVPTDTAAPTDTPLPTDAAQPTQSLPGPVGTAGPQPTANASSDCQSVVAGSVINGSGGPVDGATVLIEGANWSNAMLTNDAGQYGFGQLCPGTASLQAFLTDGQVSQLAELDLSGRDTVHVELSVVSAEAVATGASTPQQTPTPGPDMPATGSPGWLLLGAALLAAFLLLVVGTRRALTVRERTGGRD